MNPSLKSMAWIVCFSLGGLVFSSLAGENDFRISNAGDGWPVVFEDTALSPGERQAIYDDYAIICTRLSPQGSYGSKTLEGDPIRWMQYGVERWHIPEAAKEHVGLLRVEKDGSEVAVVDRALSDAYKKAFAYRDSHRAAFDCLPEFVNLMNHLNVEDLPDTLEEILYFAQDARRHADEIENGTVSHFVEVFGQCRYELPSVLDWGEFEGLPLVPLHQFPKGENRRQRFFVAVFDKGRWKMLVHSGMF